MSVLKRKRVLVAKQSSNACHTCKARKIKCDESRPTCQKCVVSNRICLGYRSTALVMATGSYTEKDPSPEDSVPVVVDNYKKHADSTQQLGTHSATATSDSMTIGPSGRKINIRSLEQLQMLSNVLEHHVLSSGAEASFAKASSFIDRLPAADLSSFIVSNAVDSMIFAHLAPMTNSPSLSIASRISYGNVLSALAPGIAYPHSQTLTNRQILYSMMIISLYDDFIPTEHRPHNDWEMHYWSIHEYLGSAGPAAFDFQNGLDRRLYQNLRIPLLFLALARRTPLIFARTEWSSSTILPKHSSIYEAALTDWYAIAAHLPALLEKADQLLLLHRESSLSDWTKSFQRINKVCEELVAWLISEIGHHKPQRITLENRSAFDMDIEEHKFLTTSDVFCEFLEYRGATMTLRVSLTLLHCLIGTCTLLRFLDSPQFSDSQPPNERQIVESRAFRHAQDLCRMVYCFSKLSPISNAHYVCVMLEIAYNFFLDFGAVKEADWCVACVEATRHRIKRMEKSEPPTVCGIGKLAGSVNALMQSMRHEQGRRRADS